MPKSLNAHPAERVDLADYLHGAVDFPRGVQDLQREITILDNQARYVRGFQIEVPNQTIFPGRLVVHAGAAIDPTGRMLFNDNQRNVSRTVTVEGANQTFWLEVEFTESDSDVDDRAFWDPTVDQGADPSGDPKPDGQEYSNNVTTRKTPDWQIVTPIRTGSAAGFARDANPNSTSVPLLKITTSASNIITSTTRVPRTTILEIVSTTPGRIRVPDPTHFGTGDVELGVGLTLGAPRETLTVSAVDYDGGLITFSGSIVNSHDPGEIIQRVDAGAPQLLLDADFGRYRRPTAPSPQDWRDRMFQGDEVHGDILSEGHDTTPDDQSSDMNLQSLKDHIDFLAGQIEEMKWGHRNPYTTGTDTEREPPGVSNDMPTTPRYFHKAGGIQGARTNAITVGDGVESWGDFIGATDTSIQAAVTAAPVGATIYVKRGTYALGADVTVTSGITLLFDTEAVVTNDGGGFDLQIPGNETLIIRGLRMSRGVGAPTTRGLYFNTTNPGQVELSDINLNQLSIVVADSVLPLNTFVNRLMMNGGAAMSAFPLVQVTHAAGQIRGTFLRCSFNNPLGLILNGACIQATTGLGLVRAKFSDCLFTTALINFSQIAMGAVSKKVTFERCEFDGLLANTTGNIVCSGGSDFRFLHCKGIDTTNRFLSLAGATDIQVDGYHNENSVTVSHLRFDNCSGVKISNCTLFSDSAGALTMGAIFLGSNSGTMSDVLINNNTIEATSNNVVGVWVDVSAGGTGLTEVQINNNEFNMCEVPMYFSATAGAGAMDNFGIRGNNCVDRGVGAATASYQKIGILVTTQVAPDFWNITGNFFTNLNPATAVTIGGAGRAGIWVYSASMSFFNIDNNQVTNIGDAANPSASEQAGIVLTSANNCTVNGNSISLVNGENAYGIMLSRGSNQAQNVVCANNDILSVTTGAGGSEVYGIVAFGMANVTFVGNRFLAIVTLAGNGGAIGCNNTGLSAIGDVAISGNTMFGAGGTTSFVQFKAKSVVNTSITGNVCSTAMRSGVEIVSAAGGSLQVISITGNSFANCLNSNIIILPNTATTRGMTISGNTLQNITAAIECIRIDDFTLFNINGNTCLTDDTTIGNNTIYITNSTRFKITNNLVRVGSTANLINQIRIGATSDFYMINDNMIDCAGSGGPISIIDSGSGATAAYITDNFWDVVPQLGVVSYGNANSTAVDAGPTSAKHGNSY